jgi:hypothetical protein
VLEIYSGAVNGDYVIAGNDGSDNNINTTDIGSSTSLQARWNRIWYVEETLGTGSTLSINIGFDFSDGGYDQTPPSSALANYRLLYRSTNSGNWTDLQGASGVTDDTVYFLVSSTLSTGYYTLGSLDTTTAPLPIELLSFDAEKENQSVLLSWQTATETNNDFFTIERSANALDWESIAQIKGAGNSNVQLSYNAIDKNPLKGISYYRLKQTDFDGAYTYSKVMAVNRDEKLETPISVYPNPATNRIQISANQSSMNEIHIFNMLGQEFTAVVSISQSGESQFAMDISSLPIGVYIIRANDSFVKVFKQ